MCRYYIHVTDRRIIVLLLITATLFASDRAIPNRVAIETAPIGSGDAQAAMRFLARLAHTLGARTIRIATRVATFAPPALQSEIRPTVTVRPESPVHAPLYCIPPPSAA